MATQLHWFTNKSHARVAFYERCREGAAASVKWQCERLYSPSCTLPIVKFIKTRKTHLHRIVSWFALDPVRKRSAAISWLRRVNAARCSKIFSSLPSTESLSLSLPFFSGCSGRWQGYMSFGILRYSASLSFIPLSLTPSLRYDSVHAALFRDSRARTEPNNRAIARALLRIAE